MQFCFSWFVKNREKYTNKGRNEKYDICGIMRCHLKAVDEDSTANILCGSMGVTCEDLKEGIQILESIAKLCSSTLIVVEDISEKREIPPNRVRILDTMINLNRNDGVPFVLTSSDADFRRNLEQGKIRQLSGDVKYVYLQPFSQSTLIYNYFIELVNSFDDRQTLLNYTWWKLGRY